MAQLLIVPGEGVDMRVLCTLLQQNRSLLHNQRSQAHMKLLN